MEATGAANILKFTIPTELGVVKAADIYVETANFVPWSWSVDGGSVWNNVNASGGAVSINRQLITSGSAFVDIRVRAADSAGTSSNPKFVGVRPYGPLPDGTTAPTFGVTTGLEVLTLGKDADYLSVFNRTNASGDNFAILNANHGAWFPDLAIIGPFTNDVISSISNWPDAQAAYRNNLIAIINALPAQCDKLLVAFPEQNATLRPKPNQSTLRSVIHRVAVEKGCAFLDLYDAYAAEGIRGFTALNAAGVSSNDGAHMALQGHKEMAARIARLLVRN